jgi:guanosine-3',5'-bis(diphosphate) 3'-pyrophosphohydrolase
MSDINPIVHLLDAVHFAADRHRHQRRKDSAASPYINHCIEVAQVLAEAGVTDTGVLMAAVLHDTVEDTETTPAEIGAHFGDRVRGLVEEVTDDKSLSRDTRKRLQVENAPRASADARLVKLADKICNVRDIGGRPPAGWSCRRCLEYLDWAEAVVAGCRGLNPSLEAAFDAALAAGRETLAPGPG